MTRGNKAMDRHGIRQMVTQVGERAGIAGANCHRFRHTFAVYFLRNDGNILELQELLGHESMETVKLYAKLAAVDLEAAQRRSSVADRWRL
ncbi:MAG: site-specific integrase [Caldilineaceae bacterium]|nr:site-specific integrase [Caldilineaceae bacterium]